MTIKPPATRLFSTAQEASVAVATEIANLIKSSSEPVVLGLATGGTPLKLYAELIRLHRVEGLSFKNVITFNLDEYLGIPPQHPLSYWTFMHQHLFDHIDVPASQIHIPNGSLAESDQEQGCAAFEDAITEVGGIDLQVLGIGLNGHIGFNEPGSPPDTRTRVIELSESTAQRAASDFGGMENVPKQAITMGVATILDAKSIAMLAFGESKTAIIRRALNESITAEVPATYLQQHDDTTYYLDEAAATGVPF